MCLYKYKLRTMRCFIWRGSVFELTESLVMFFELTESYQKLQRIVSTTQGYQISCPLLPGQRV